MLYPKSIFLNCFICKNCLEFPVLLGHEVLFGLAGQSYPKSENNNVKNGAGRSRSEPVGARRSQTETAWFGWSRSWNLKAAPPASTKKAKQIYKIFKPRTKIFVNLFLSFAIFDKSTAELNYQCFGLPLRRIQIKKQCLNFICLPRAGADLGARARSRSWSWQKTDRLHNCDYYYY